jgi:hypothetical protein
MFVAPDLRQPRRKSEMSVVRAIQRSERGELLRMFLAHSADS